MANKLLISYLTDQGISKESNIVKFINKYSNQIIKIDKHRDLFSEYFGEKINEDYIVLLLKGKVISKGYMMTSGWIKPSSEMKVYLSTLNYYPERCGLKLGNESEFKEDLTKLY